ncbi:MAG: hypothetical protein DRH90_23285 [Deltaproteobacteria bacterium]|nr:MAG: hypothetical protein DRH90_23285 [Deltaproteobacteria bacterium]
MIIQRAGVLKYLRYLGIFCALTMGFFSIVATSEDDVEDALDLTFDKDFDLTVEEITVDKTTETTAAEVFEECELGLTVNDGIANLEDADVPDMDIDNVTLNAFEARYKDATWDPGNETLTCEVSLTQVGGDGTNDITVGPITITQSSATWSPWITITPADVSAINYYLQNRDAAFDLCVECDDNASAIDTFSVTFEVNFDVNIEGSL